MQTKTSAVFAVYASDDEGALWKQVGVFDTVEAADQRAAAVVHNSSDDEAWEAGSEGRGAPRGGDKALDGPWTCAESLVVEFPDGDEAPAELPLDLVVPIRSRFLRGGPQPGPAMELSLDNASNAAPDNAPDSPGQP